MKRLFLTSSLGTYRKIAKGNEIIKEIIKCNNSNNFIDRLKAVTPKIESFVFISSNPDDSKKTDDYCNTTVKSLNLDGFGIEKIQIIDHRFNGDIEAIINSADVVYLAGGNVPIQNRYFEEINLKHILNKYNGVVIGQSAGSMNCSKIVYTQPEEDYEFEDKNYQRVLSGLGLVDFTIMPHMNFANIIDEKGHPCIRDMCLEDSYAIPHYGICDYGFIEVQGDNAIAYGKTFLIKNGECIEICGDKEKINISPDYSFAKKI